jgi:hypothetical protein
MFIIIAVKKKRFKNITPVFFIELFSEEHKFGT